MNKNTMLILGFIGIIIFFYLFTGKKIIEGLDGDGEGSGLPEATIGVDLVGNPEQIVREPSAAEDNPQDTATSFKTTPSKTVPKNQCDPPVVIAGQKCPPQKVISDKQYCYNTPRYGPPKDPNAGLITTCTNLVRSHVNKCSAGAAGLMTRAFGPTIQKDDKHQHATDSQLLGFLKRMEAKLRGMTEHKKITDQAIKLAPKFAPKFEYPKRRGLSYDEYNMWRNVLTKGNVPDSNSKDGPTAPPSSRNGDDKRDIKIYVTDNRNVKGNSGSSSQQNSSQQSGGQQSDGKQSGGGNNSSQSGNYGPLDNGYSSGTEAPVDAYNVDDY